MLDFTFIRPELLWLLLPVALLFSVLLLKNKKAKQLNLIAPHLAQFVIDESPKQAKQPLSLVALFCLLAVIFSAGPSFEEKRVPVFQSKNARVIVMDMSLSMYSTDITPNRLMQARYKALDMIELFKEGDTALVAYAGSAYTISPLTNDAATLKNLIPSLSPEIMPDKGSNILAGLDLGQELLTQAGYNDGDIILITDGIEQSEQADISQFTANSKYRLNIYGVGTEQGAPIKLPDGGFLKDSYGQIVVPKLNQARLQSLASNSGGKFTMYQPNDRDIATFAPSANAQTLKSEKQSQVLWRIDAGIYGLIILLPLAVWLFRRAAFLGAFLLFSFLPNQHAYANELTNLFKNQEQRALDAYQQGDYEQAASNANTKQLKGAALYKQGSYDAAIEQFSQDSSATGFYNTGNALAKAGKLDEALSAYNQALKLDPDFTEAKDNQALVEQLKQQEEQQEKNKDEQQQKEDGEQQPNQQGDQSQKNDDNSDQSKQQSEQDKSQQSQQDEKNQQQNGEPSKPQSDEKNNPDMQAEPEPSESQADKKNKAKQTEPPSNSSPEPQEVSAEQQSEAEKNTEQQAMQAQTAELTNEEKEKAQQLNQLLRQVPDDPAILLRNKMQLEAQKRNNQRRPQGVEKSW